MDNKRLAQAINAHTERMTAQEGHSESYKTLVDKATAELKTLTSRHVDDFLIDLFNISGNETLVINTVVDGALVSRAVITEPLIQCSFRKEILIKEKAEYYNTSFYDFGATSKHQKEENKRIMQTRAVIPTEKVRAVEYHSKGEKVLGDNEGAKNSKSYYHIVFDGYELAISIEPTAAEELKTA